MSNNTRTTLLVFLTLIVIALVSVGAALLLTKPQPTEPPAPLPDIIESPAAFESQPHYFPEGYRIDLVNGWEITAIDTERAVDRYRFENGKGGILTLSFYENGLSGGFDDLIERRYGGAALAGKEDLEINGLPAMRLYADFLMNGGGLRSGADVLIKATDQLFVSVYGLHQPDGESSANITAELDFMQQSFKKTAF